MTRLIRISMVLLLVCVPRAAFATWSVVALNSKTGQAVVASATCVTGANLVRRAPPFGLRSIQAIVVPGKAAAAAQANVDSRCSCDSLPKTPAPCTTKTAHIAYILLAEKTDTNKASYSDGDYSMFISVSETDIKADEAANPVKTLRLRYEAWKRAKR
jgi:hypothetical protein